MKRFGAIALFCDSVRDEVQGSTSLIGIMPDRVDLAKIPSAIPRLTVYARVSYPVNDPPKNIEWFLRFPNGLEEAHSHASTEQIVASLKGGNGVVAGIITEIIAAPFTIVEEGPVKAVVVVDGEEWVAAAVQFSAAH